MSQFTTELSLVKARLGITSTVRDDFLTAIIDGIKKELLDHNGITYTSENKALLMYLVDLASWRYSSHGEQAVPRHIQYRLNNIIAKGLADATTTIV